jgi:ELWxxDGT repeat protein
MRLHSLATAGATLSLMGLLLATAGQAEALQLSRIDINPGSRGSYPTNLTVFDNALYFIAYDGVHDGDLWKYDGTTASLVGDTDPGSRGSFNYYLRVFDNALYVFRSSYEPRNTELWKYDGTTARLVAEIFPSSKNFFLSGVTVFNNALYFSATNGANGYELWKYDGTKASLVSDIFRGRPASSSSNLTVFNNALYLSGTTWQYGTELWKYDGLAYGPHRPSVSLAADINPGRTTVPGWGNSSNPSYLTIFDNALYFSADDGVHGNELWKYDGTTASLVADINPGKDLLGRGSSSSPSRLRVFDNALYFSANDGVHGNELWKYDGTTASLVADLNPGSGSSYLGGSTVFNNSLYFSLYDGVHGTELWKYDGTTASLVADLNPGSQSSEPGSFTVFNNALYFNANDGVHGYELWKLEPDVSTSVPEPASGLGLLTFGAIGANSMLKRKQKKPLNSVS